MGIFVSIIFSLVSLRSSGMIVGERGGEACRYECVGFHRRNRKEYVCKVCTCEWNPNNNPSLARTTQKAAHCLGFENSPVDEGSFGDSAIASHETVDLVGYKSLERCLTLTLSPWFALCSFLLRTSRTGFRPNHSISVIWFCSSSRPEVKQI